MSLSEMIHYQKNASKLSIIITVTDWGQNIHVPYSLLQREKITKHWYIGEINDLPFHIKSQRMKTIAHQFTVFSSGAMGKKPCCHAIPWVGLYPNFLALLSKVSDTGEKGKERRHKKRKLNFVLWTKEAFSHLSHLQPSSFYILFWFLLFIYCIHYIFFPLFSSLTLAWQQAS